MAGVLSRPLFRQHYQTGGGVSDPWGYSSDQWERGKGMAGEALERGKGLMERLRGVPPGGVGAGPVNAPPGGFGSPNLPVPTQSSDELFRRTRIGATPAGKSGLGSLLGKAGRVAGAAGRFAVNPYVLGATVGIPLAYDALTDSPEDVLAQLDPETRSYVAYLIDQGLSLEEALERATAPAQEEAPLEMQAGDSERFAPLRPLEFPVQHFALGGLAALGAGALALKSTPAALGSGAALLGYHALTSSGRQEQEALALLPPEQKAQVKALVDQGMSVEDALETVDASVQEEAPLEMQAGGPVMPPQAMMPPQGMPPQGMPPQAMMPPPQAGPAGMDALISKAPEILNQAEGAVSNRMEDVGREYVNDTLSAVDMAEDPEELINALRGTDVPLEQRYDELAQIVGEQDAEATPPSVLALVQPAIMMTEQGAVDSGIGNLMQEFSSSAEMLTEEGEATPMGEGLGNLMMAGAQPAMEALPPEAMMGPPPGAMMPPPPGGMAYGGPVQRFAYGGPVQHFAVGQGVEKPGFFGSIANLFRDEPGSVASVTRKKKGLLGFGDDELVVNPDAYKTPVPIGTDFLDLDPDRQRSTPESRRRYLTPDTAIRDPRVNIMGMIPQEERVTAGTVTAPKGYTLPTMDSLDPGFDLMTNYADPERLKRQFKERLPLYEDLLGSGQDQKDFTKSQMLFDIAGAGLNFAGGRGAGGENVASRSPAAQFAAAFSQVPKTMGERIAQQRQEQLAIKSSALQAAEREETATRSAALSERSQKIGFSALKSREEFAAKITKLENETTREFQTRLSNVQNQLTAMLSNQRMNTQLKERGLLGAIQERLAEVSHTNALQQSANSFGQIVERDLIRGEQALTQQSRQMQGMFKLQQYRTTYDTLAAKRLTEYNVAKANRDFDWQEDLQDWREDVEDDTQDFREDVRKDAFELIKLKQEFMEDMQLNRDDLIEENRLRRAIQEQAGDQSYNQFMTALDAKTLQFEKSHGLAVTGQQLQKARWDMLSALEYMKQTGTPDLDLTEGPFGGKDALGRTSNVFGNKDLWDRYAAGTLDADTESYLNAYITSATQSKWDPQLNQEVPGMLLPRPVLDAIAVRRDNDPNFRAPYLSRKDPRYAALEERAGLTPLN
jgi:hypothetical protein